MYQIRNKTLKVLKFSRSFERISHGYSTNFFTILTIKFLKLNRKENSQYHVEGPRSGTIFFKILKKTFIKSFPLFKCKLKLKLVSFKNKITYF